jgi:hypothetical protein
MPYYHLMYDKQTIVYTLVVRSDRINICTLMLHAWLFLINLCYIIQLVRVNKTMLMKLYSFSRLQSICSPEFTPGFQWGSCYSIFSFMCMFCRSLFVFLYFFFWSVCCLFFFDVRILITPLVSSNSSCLMKSYLFCKYHISITLYLISDRSYI